MQHRREAPVRVLSARSRFVLWTRGEHGLATDQLSAANVAMDRYASGDDTAFGLVYDALAPRLYPFLLRKTRDPSRAEDLVQQTFLQMHCARETYVTGADVLPWAFAIARRLAIDAFRKGDRERLSGDGVSLDAALVRRLGPDAALRT